MKHVYCGDLVPDSSGWDFMHSLERDEGYQGFIIGENKFTKFCNVTEFADPIADLIGMKHSVFTFYGSPQVDILFAPEILSASFFVTLRLTKVSKDLDQILKHPLLKDIIVTPEVMLYIEANNLKKTKRATYTVLDLEFDPDLLGPMVNSPEKGFLLIGASDALLEEVKVYLAAILHTKAAKSIEFYIDKNAFSEDGQRQLQAYLRASGALAAIIFVDITDHHYYADIFSSSFMCIDLTKQYVYYRSCLQYRTVYYTGLEEANGNVFFKLWTYTYFKNKELHEQAVKFAERT